MSDIVLYDCLPTGWRLGKIIHIKSVICCDSLTDDFKEFIEDLDDREPTQDIYRQLPFLTLFRDAEDAPEEWEILEAFSENAVEGFFVQIEAEVPTYLGNGIWKSSWGYYQRQWVYVKNIGLAEIAAHNLSISLRDKAKLEAA